MNPVKWIVLIALFCGSAYAADLTVSRYKPYSLNPAPNYSVYSAELMGKALTDGNVPSGGIMWLRAGSLGWVKSGPVTITVDLGVRQSVDRVSFRTARRRAADVQFPANAFVYLSEEGRRYSYVGDARSASDDFDDNSYEDKQFVLSGIGALARFVRIVFIPIGPFFFTDEIEVEAGGNERSLVPSLYSEDIVADAMSRSSGNRVRTVERLANRVLDGLGAPEGKVSELRRAALLGKRFPGKEMIIDTVSPWATDTPIDLPRDVFVSNQELVVADGSCAFRAFSISNPKSKNLVVRFRQDGERTRLFEAKPILTAGFKQVFDPLVELSGEMNIPEGATRLLFAKFCSKGMSVLNIVGPSSDVVARTSVKISPRLNESDYPFSIVWAYPEIGFLKGIKEGAEADLKSHHTNVAVLHTSQIPRLEDAADRMEKIFSQYRQTRRVLLFLDFRINPPRLEDEEWKTRFVKWYGGIRLAAKNAGLSENKVMLYPYDEPRGEEVQKFRQFASWIRMQVSDVKIFSTLGAKESIGLLPLLDVACVHRARMPVIASKTEIWVYDSQGPGKTNSSYAYYRLLPWFAYLNKAVGAGFWSYGDASGSPWDDFDGKFPDYAVVYDDVNRRVISSRRWEAWGQGLEDVALLKRYALLVGEVEARRIAQGVVRDPNNFEKADDVRRRIFDILMN